MNKTAIIYLSPYDILRPRTNQVSDVRFCEGFAQNGCEVHLIVPTVERADNILPGEIAQVYGLEQALNYHFLDTQFKADVSGKRNLAKVGWLATKKALALVRSLRGSNITIISRNAPLLQLLLLWKKWLPGLKGVQIIHWAHEYKSRKSYRRIYSLCDGILATNSSIIHDMCAATGIPTNKTCVTGNPITEEQLRNVQPRQQARIAAQLTTISKPLIVYTGKLAVDYREELTHIMEAASLLPDCQFLLTGGKPEAVKWWSEWCAERNIQNVLFTGYIYDYSKIRHFQQAADVLVSYYTNFGHDIRYNLPNKICEYMLSGNVIVTPDFPATRDLLNNKNCIFVKPENSSALAEGIREAVTNPLHSSQLAAQASADVKEITFRKRTKRVIDFIETLR